MYATEHSYCTCCCCMHKEKHYFQERTGLPLQNQKYRAAASPSALLLVKTASGALLQLPHCCCRTAAAEATCCCRSAAAVGALLLLLRHYCCCGTTAAATLLLLHCCRHTAAAALPHCCCGPLGQPVPQNRNTMPSVMRAFWSCRPTAEHTQLQHTTTVILSETLPHTCIHGGLVLECRQMELRGLYAHPMSSRAHTVTPPSPWVQRHASAPHTR